MTFREFFTFNEFIRRVDLSIAWLTSFFNDPVTEKKGSITRLCGFLSTVAAIWCAWATFDYARKNTGATGVIGILAGLTGTLLTAAAAKFFLRTTPSGASEPVNNTAPATVTQTTTTATEVKP